MNNFLDSSVLLLFTQIDVLFSVISCGFNGRIVDWIGYSWGWKVELFRWNLGISCLYIILTPFNLALSSIFFIWRSMKPLTFVSIHGDIVGFCCDGDIWYNLPWPMKMLEWRFMIYIYDEMLDTCSNFFWSSWVIHFSSHYLVMYIFRDISISPPCFLDMTVARLSPFLQIKPIWWCF